MSNLKYQEFKFYRESVEYRDGKEIISGYFPEPHSDVEYIMDETGCYYKYLDEDGEEVIIGYMKNA